MSRIKKPPLVKTSFRAWPDVRERIEQERDRINKEGLEKVGLADVLNSVLYKHLPKNTNK